MITLTCQKIMQQILLSFDNIFTYKPLSRRTYLLISESVVFIYINEKKSLLHDFIKTYILMNFWETLPPIWIFGHTLLFGPTWLFGLTQLFGRSEYGHSKLILNAIQGYLRWLKTLKNHNKPLIWLDCWVCNKSTVWLGYFLWCVLWSFKTPIYHCVRRGGGGSQQSFVILTELLPWTLQPNQMFGQSLIYNGSFKKYS
jgi:hypothetical protein